MDRLICILGALREEINLIKGKMVVEDQFKIGRADAWTGKWDGVGIILVRTGIGKNCALSALEQVLNLVNPSLILSIGYAGGLNPKLKVGDVILANHVLKINADFLDVGSYAIDSKHLELLEGLNYPGKVKIYKGKLITVDQVIDSSAIKQELGLRYNALAVDMETAAFLAHATKKDIALLSIRSISDTAEQSLINVSSFIGDDGEIAKLKAGWYAMTHPHSIKNFVSLQRQSQLATRNMTEFIEFFLRAHRHYA